MEQTNRGLGGKSDMLTVVITLKKMLRVKIFKIKYFLLLYPRLRPFLSFFTASIIVLPSHIVKNTIKFYCLCPNALFFLLC